MARRRRRGGRGPRPGGGPGAPVVIGDVAAPIAAGNGDDGFSAVGGAQMTLESCVARGNETGLKAVGPTPAVGVATSVEVATALGLGAAARPGLAGADGPE